MKAVTTRPSIIRELWQAGGERWRSCVMMLTIILTADAAVELHRSGWFVGLLITFEAALLRVACVREVSERRSMEYISKIQDLIYKRANCTYIVTTTDKSAAYGEPK